MPKSHANNAQTPFKYWHEYKLKDGTVKRVQRWKVRVDLGTGADGKRIRKTLTAATSAECRRKLKEARRQLGTTGVISTSGRTLGQYMKHLLDMKAMTSSPNTRRIYHGSVKRLEQWSGLKVTAITPTTVEGILMQLGKQGFSFNTRRATFSVLSQALERAVVDRVIAANPCRSVRLTQPKGMVSDRRAFTVDETRAILAATLDMPIADAAIWWWRMMTAMRQGEILGAQVQYLHLNADQPWYELRWSLTFISRDHGCGRSRNGEWACGKALGGLCPQAVWRVPENYVFQPLQGGLCLVPPKSGKPRMVPIIPELAEVMRRYLAATVDRPNPYGLLFRNEDGSPRSDKQDMREFKALLRKAGLDPSTRHGHETRYTGVTLMRRAGVDRKAEMEIVGHASLDVDDIYMTVDAEQRSRAMNAIGEALDLKQLPGD